MSKTTFGRESSAQTVHGPNEEVLAVQHAIHVFVVGEVLHGVGLKAGYISYPGFVGFSHIKMDRVNWNSITWSSLPV
jgi:hypothetical protein